MLRDLALIASTLVGIALMSHAYEIAKSRYVLQEQRDRANFWATFLGLTGFGAALVSTVEFL